MNTTKILGEAVGIQSQGVVDRTETQTKVGLTSAIIIGQFKRGRVDRPMTIHNGNIRGQLGYEPNNPYYMAVQDCLDTGVPSVEVLRVGSIDNGSGDGGSGDGGSGDGGDNGGGDGGDGGSNGGDGGNGSTWGNPFIIRYDSTVITDEDGTETHEIFSNVNAKYILREVIGDIRVTINDGAVRTYDGRWGYLTINDFNVYLGDVVKIYGSFTRIEIDNVSVFQEDRDKYIYDIVSFGDNPLIKVTCGENVRHVPKVKPPTLGVSGMFRSYSDGQRYFTGEDVVDWDVWDIVSFASTFRRCSHMTVSLDHWDYTNATEISGFLVGSSAQFGEYLFPAATSCYQVFGGNITEDLTIILPLPELHSNTFREGFNIAEEVKVTILLESATDTQNMFGGSVFNDKCELTLIAQDVTNCSFMFSHCTFIGTPILNVDYTNAENVQYLFGWCDFTQASEEFKDLLRLLHTEVLNSDPTVFSQSIGI